MLVVAKVQKCERCQRRYRGSGDWNVTTRDGEAIGILCPTCQTPEENVEAVVNQATLVYARDAAGRTRGKPEDGPTDVEGLAIDLLRRTEDAVMRLASLAADTGITMSLDDAVQMVEDGLPSGYPMPAEEGTTGRRAMIALMARDLFSGDAYED